MPIFGIFGACFTFHRAYMWSIRSKNKKYKTTTQNMLNWKNGGMKKNRSKNISTHYVFNSHCSVHVHNKHTHTKETQTIFWISWFGTWNADISLRYAIQTKPQPYGQMKRFFLFTFSCDVFVFAVLRWQFYRCLKKIGKQMQSSAANYKYLKKISN